MDQVIGARAFDVLAPLPANAGRVVFRAQLLGHVWADLNVEESNLTVQIAALRKVLGRRAIATVPGLGYQFTQNHATKPAQIQPGLALPDKPSLAVMPLTNLTGDAGKDYLVVGIVADLIAALSRIPVFFVIAESRRASAKPTRSLSAYDLCLRAMPKAHRMSGLDDFLAGAGPLGKGACS